MISGGPRQSIGGRGWDNNMWPKVTNVSYIYISLYRYIKRFFYMSQNLGGGPPATYLRSATGDFSRLLNSIKVFVLL